MNKVYLFLYVFVSVAYFISVSKLNLKNLVSRKRSIYFFFYITCNLLTLSFVFFFTIAAIEIMQLLIIASHINSFLFLFLHTRALINQEYKFSSSSIFFGCNAFLAFLFLLNYQGFYFLSNNNSTNLLHNLYIRLACSLSGAKIKTCRLEFSIFISFIDPMS